MVFLHIVFTLFQDEVFFPHSAWSGWGIDSSGEKWPGEAKGMEGRACGGSRHWWEGCGEQDVGGGTGTVGGKVQVGQICNYNLEFSMYRI